MNRNIERQMQKYLVSTMLLTSLFVILTMLLSVGGSALNLLSLKTNVILTKLERYSMLA